MDADGNARLSGSAAVGGHLVCARCAAVRDAAFLAGRRPTAHQGDIVAIAVCTSTCSAGTPRELRAAAGPALGWGWPPHRGCGGRGGWHRLGECLINGGSDDQGDASDDGDRRGGRAGRAGGQAPSSAVPEEQLVAMLVDRARREGLQLTGQGGLLPQLSLTRRVVATAPTPGCAGSREPRSPPARRRSPHSPATSPLPPRTSTVHATPTTTTRPPPARSWRRPCRAQPSTRSSPWSARADPAPDGPLARQRELASNRREFGPGGRDGCTAVLPAGGAADRDPAPDTAPPGRHRDNGPPGKGYGLTVRP